MRPVNIGYGNAVVAERVVAIVSPESAPTKRFKEEAQGGTADRWDARAANPARSSRTPDHIAAVCPYKTETVAERLERGGVGAAEPGAPRYPGTPRARDEV